MTRLLITGATGLLGSSLAREAARAYQVFGLSRERAAFSSSWKHVPVDLTDGGATRRCLDEVRPDLILHCAAVTDVERCEAQREYAEAMNVGATERIAQWAGQHGARLTFISTDSVFDGTAGGYREEDAPRPVNHYARTKLAGEQAATSLCADSLIVRTNFYGWNENGKPNLAKWILGKLFREETLEAFTDVRFSALFANDLATVILELISRGASGVFHVAARNSCSKYEFAVLVCRAFRFDSQRIKPTVLEEFSFAAARPRNTSLSAAKCERFLGREMPDVEQGVAAFAQAMHAFRFMQVHERQVSGKAAAVSR